MQLPAILQTALDDVLASFAPKEIAPLAQDLSTRYRQRNTSGHRFVRTPQQAIAYAAFRLPATFAAVFAVLSQVQQSLPGWQPRTMIDVGAGPGTAAWATMTVWPELHDIHLVEREEAMITLGKNLASHAPGTPLSRATWHRMDLTQLSSQPSSDADRQAYDLVIASYVLGELPPDIQPACYQALWELTRGVLVIIEPGTTDGFQRIKAVRTGLIAAGAHMIAPCPHSDTCPIAGSDWCHFSQRVQRSPVHKRVKSGELPYEDEKFSYVAVSRIPALVAGGRVLRHPEYRKGHVRLQLCTPEGLKTVVVTRKSGERYRYARKLKWGSAIAHLEDVGGQQP